MHRKRTLLFVLLPAPVIAGVLFVFAIPAPTGQTKPREIVFELNRPIRTVARESGATGFGKRNYHGLISYDLGGQRASTVFKYNQPGYEITWDKVFAFTMYADSHYTRDAEVNTISLQHDRFESLEEMKVLVDQTIAQFQAGKWERYLSNDEPRVSGRSSLLDEHDKLQGTILYPDPAYVIPDEDWPTIARKSIYWRWTGDGVHAELHVTGSGQILGHAHLTFEDIAHRQYILLKERARSVRRDQKYGWDMYRYDETGRERREANRRIEARALERGDHIVP